MQGFEIFDKPMQLAYARKKSDAISKKEGTFQPRVRVRKPKRQTVEEATAAAGAESAAAAAAATGIAAGSVIPAGAPPTAAGAAAAVAAAAAAGAPAAAAAASAANLAKANKILFAKNIPKDSTKDEVKALFAACTGLKEIRLIAVKGVAFIEFDDVRTAAVALAAVAGATIRENTLNITFAAK